MFKEGYVSLAEKQYFTEAPVYRTFCRIENQDGVPWSARGEFEDYNILFGKGLVEARSTRTLEFDDDDINIYLELEKAIASAISDYLEDNDHTTEVKLIEVTEFWDEELGDEIEVIQSISIEEIVRKS